MVSSTLFSMLLMSCAALAHVDRETLHQRRPRLAVARRNLSGDVEQIGFRGE